MAPLRCSGHKRWRSYAIDTGALGFLRHGQVKRHDTWRAGCGENRTSGSEGGPEKPTSRNAGRALRPDPYTKLRAVRKWTYYHLYVLLDIYSRYVVGWMLAHRESGNLAAKLIEETCAKQTVGRDQLIIHADRGSAPKSKTVAQMFADLGIEPSHSRPHVSNDNPFSEAQFKTLKYRPTYPKRFGSYEHALSYCRDFFDWYNVNHRHAGIAMLTSDVVHHGGADDVLLARQRVLDDAYVANPERFVNGRPIVESLPGAVWINPPEDKARSVIELQ